MEPATLIEYFPKCFHVCAAGSWPMVARHGLLSTSALLDLFEYEGRARSALESSKRAQNVTISHERHGEAVLRDQKPLSDGTLKECLGDDLGRPTGTRY